MSRFATGVLVLWCMEFFQEIEAGIRWFLSFPTCTGVEMQLLPRMPLIGSSVSGVVYAKLANLPHTARSSAILT
jgi:hypothetical protein